MSSAKKTPVKWFGMKLTPDQKKKIETLANRRGVSQKQAVMDLVEQEVTQNPIEPNPGSFYDKNKDSCGMFEGPEDLSTNPKYMEGFGK